jgi:hypothetical protein
MQANVNIQRAMAWHNYAPPRMPEKKKLDDSLPTIQKQNIVDQIVIALHQSGIKWVPMITEENLVAQNQGRETKFVFLPIRLVYSSSVLTLHTNIMGAPLPHPVDGSFIFMVASLAASSIENQIRQHRESFQQAHLKQTSETGCANVLSDEEMNDYLRKAMMASAGLKEVDDDAKKLTFNPRKFIGFILFHHHRRGAQSSVTPKYGNFCRFFMYISKLVISEISRGVYLLANKNQIFNIYQVFKRGNKLV